MMKSRSKQIIVSLFLICAVIVGVFSPSYAQADGDPENLALANRDYKPGDLYASIIFSESAGNETADSVDLSYSKIESYPSYYDNTMTYGRLLKPEEKSPAKGRAGKELTSMFRTIYDYGWFEPAPIQASGFFGRATQLLGQIVDGAERTYWTGSAISAASVSQDAFFKIARTIEWFNSVLSGISIPSLFGFDSSKIDGLVELALSGAFNFLGLDPRVIKILQGFVYIFIVAAFILTVMTILRSSRNLNKDKIAKPFKNYGSRAVIIIMTVPLSVMLTTIVDSISVKASVLNTMPDLLNQAYVVDTVDWAVYGNFDLSMINPNGSLKDDGSISTDFAPTPENVARLNAAIQAKKALIGPRRSTTPSSSSTLSDVEKDAQASSLALGQFASRTESNVTAYFDGLAKLRDRPFNSCGVYNAHQTATATEAIRRENYDFRKISVGYTSKSTSGTSDKNYIYDECGLVYFMTPKLPKSDNALGQTGQNAADAVNSAAGNAATTQPSKITLSGQVFKIGDSSPVSVKPFNASDPQSYLYGSVPNLSKSTKEFANYIHDPERSSQLVNPETGEKVSPAEGSSAEDLKARSIWTNSLRIALTNRYRGLKPLSFSDQSTAFFLQTQRSGEDSISYKGFYTVAAKAGEAKNTGQYGVTFIRYLIPSYSMSDLWLRISSLAVIWNSAFMIAVAALIIMFRSPLIKAVSKSIKGFLSALFTGNVVGLIDYVLYYTAMRMSLIFVGASIYMGTIVSKWLIVDTGLSNTTTIADAAVFDNAFNPMSYILPAITTIITFVATVVVLWPSIRMMGPKGVMTKKSLVGVIINFPFLIADMLSEKADVVHQRAYGHSRGQGMMGLGQMINRGSKAERRQDRQQRKAHKKANQSTLKKAGKVGLELGAHAGAAVVTGGASLGVSKAMLMSKAPKGLTGFASAALQGKAVTSLSKNQTFQKMFDPDKFAGKMLKADGISRALFGRSLVPESEDLRAQNKADHDRREENQKQQLERQKKQQLEAGSQKSDAVEPSGGKAPALQVVEGGRSIRTVEVSDDTREIPKISPTVLSSAPNVDVDKIAESLSKGMSDAADSMSRRVGEELSEGTAGLAREMKFAIRDSMEVSQDSLNSSSRPVENSGITASEMREALSDHARDLSSSGSTRETIRETIHEVSESQTIQPPQVHNHNTQNVEINQNLSLDGKPLKGQQEQGPKVDAGTVANLAAEALKRANETTENI